MFNSGSQHTEQINKWDSLYAKCLEGGKNEVIKETGV